MKVKEFIERTSSSNSLCKSCMEKEVKIHATINDKYVGELSNIKVTRVGYRFNPFNHEGCLALDLNILL